MLTKSRRPEGPVGDLDRHLPRVKRALKAALAPIFRQMSGSVLRPTSGAAGELVDLLVDLGEDLHCDLGLWRALERHHRACFQTPLPFLVPAGGEVSVGPIAQERIQHFLWVIYPRIVPDVLTTPDHRHLVALAGRATEVLRAQFAGLPRDSGIQRSLSTSNKEGWVVKRKLIWLGTQSYLFRLLLRDYVADQGQGASEIAVIDDFLCQNCTEWAGLGALDVLAEALRLPEDRRADLLAWSQRHNALYQVLASSATSLELLNLVSNQTYRVRMNLGRDAFRGARYVMGSLVWWDGAWYWSGEQNSLGQLDETTVAQVLAGYRAKPSLYYRYAKDVMEKARAIVRQQYEDFLARHGKAWVAFPTGEAMVAD